MKCFRWISCWLIFLACHFTLGTAVFHVVRYLPRRTFVITSTTNIEVSPDGARLMTVEKLDEGAAVKVWNTLNGELEYEKSYPDAVIGRAESRSHPLLFWFCRDNTWRVLDWSSQQEWHLNESKFKMQLDISPKGRWVCLTTEKECCLFDTKARKVVLRSINDPVFGLDDTIMLESGSKIWDLDTLTVRGTLNAKAIGSTSRISPDGRLLLVYDGTPIGTPIPKKGFRTNVDVFDLEKVKQQFHLEIPLEKQQFGNLECAFSPDSRFLALWHKVFDKGKSDLQMIDTASGKKLWSYVMIEGHSITYTSDGSRCAFIHNGGLTLFNTARGDIIWERPSCQFAWFAPGDRDLFFLDDSNEILHFFDTRTGQIRAAAPVRLGSAFRDFMPTPDGRYVVVHGLPAEPNKSTKLLNWFHKQFPSVFGTGSSAVHVVETATGRELFHIDRAGVGGYASDDGTTLLTLDGPIDDTIVLRFWNVSPAKAWEWTIGVVAVGGLVVLGAWRLIKKRRALNAAPSAGELVTFPSDKHLS